eukprot:PhM_4_TR1253/c2_g9_i1/m.81126
MLSITIAIIILILLVHDIFVRGQPIVLKRAPQRQLYRSHVMFILHHLHEWLLFPADRAIGAMIRINKTPVYIVGGVGVVLLALPLFIVAAVLRVILFPFRSNVVFISGSSNRTSSSSRRGEVTLATLNVALTEFDIMNAINHLPPSSRRIDGVISFLLSCQADVICCQELFSPTLALKIAKVLSNPVHGYDVCFQVDPPTPFGMSSGLLLAVSRTGGGGIQGVAFEAFLNGYSDDALARKGVLAAMIMDGRGVVATTHLQAAMSAHVDLVRAAQVQVVRRVAESVQPALLSCESGGEDSPPPTIILCGDFNTTSCNAAVRTAVLENGSGDGYVFIPPSCESTDNFTKGSCISWPLINHNDVFRNSRIIDLVLYKSKNRDNDQNAAAGAAAKKPVVEYIVPRCPVEKNVVTDHMCGVVTLPI